MLFVPVGAFVDYTSTLTLLPHKFLYASYPTPLDSQNVYMDYYTIGESYTAGQQIPARYIPLLQLVLLVGLLAVLLSISTYLSRYWFLLSQGIFAAILYSCNIDQLRLFGRVDYLPYVGLLSCYVLIAWHIQHRGSHLSLTWRILIFCALTVLIAICINYFSASTTPFLILSSQTYYAQLCMGLLFCLLVGHEIPYFLLKLTSSAGFGNSGFQFIGVFLLYMAHLILFFLHNIGTLSWDVYYLNEFVFLAISTFIGVWSFQKRAHQYYYLLPAPYQQLVYLLLGAFTFFTITYLRISGNDPAIEVFEDSILFGHIGFGLGFFVYVLMSFGKPLFSNMPVWQVVYQHAETPFLVVRLFGLIGLFVCYSFSRKAAYNHALSGEQVQLATLHMRRQQPALAQQYYTQAAAYGYQSHEPNYALGHLAAQKAYTIRQRSTTS